MQEKLLDKYKIATLDMRTFHFTKFTEYSKENFKVCMIKKEIGKATLYCADCKDVLPLLKDIDSCVTDPPYGLSFMGKGWDYDVPSQDIWSLVFDSLKQGSHLLSFLALALITEE